MTDEIPQEWCQRAWDAYADARDAGEDEPVVVMRAVLAAVLPLIRSTRTDVPDDPDARSVPDPVLCAACGGTGHRNGNRRAADPFGTCPGCDGTGKASRRIIVYDARAGRCGLTVPVGCTVGDAAWLAVAAMGVRVGPDDCPSLAVNGSGLHPANPLPDDLDFELVVIGGTV